MKRIGSWNIALILILTLLLSACGRESVSETINELLAPGTGLSTAQNPSSPNLSYAVPQNLDAAFNSFLDNMVEYNALNLAGLNEMLAEKNPYPFCSTFALWTKLRRMAISKELPSSRCSSSARTLTFCHRSTPPSLPTAAVVGAARSP